MSAPFAPVPVEHKTYTGHDLFIADSQTPVMICGWVRDVKPDLTDGTRCNKDAHWQVRSERAELVWQSFKEKIRADLELGEPRLVNMEHSLFCHFHSKLVVEVVNQHCPARAFSRQNAIKLIEDAIQKLSYAGMILENLSESDTDALTIQASYELRSSVAALSHSPESGVEPEAFLPADLTERDAALELAESGECGTIQLIKLSIDTDADIKSK